MSFEEDKLKKLPKYARSIRPEYLVRILCHKCVRSRYATLNKPCKDISVIRNAKIGEYIATCWKCGIEDISRNSWSRPSL